MTTAIRECVRCEWRPQYETQPAPPCQSPISDRVYPDGHKMRQLEHSGEREDMLSMSADRAREVTGQIVGNAAALFSDQARVRHLESLPPCPVTNAIHNAPKGFPMCRDCGQSV